MFFGFEFMAFFVMITCTSYFLDKSLTVWHALNAAMPPVTPTTMCFMVVCSFHCVSLPFQPARLPCPTTDYFTLHFNHISQKIKGFREKI